MLRTMKAKMKGAEVANLIALYNSQIAELIDIRAEWVKILQTQPRNYIAAWNASILATEIQEALERRNIVLRSL